MIRKRTLEKVAAYILIFVWVCTPIAPVIQWPSSNEPITLDVEIQLAHADPFGNGYGYRRSITINESQVTGTGNLTNFPVLMSFSDATLRTTGNGGNVTDAQGDDIIFTSDSAGSTVLDFEMERYDAATGEVTAWVEIPTLDFDDNTVVYMFYGNSGVSTSQEDIAGTWDGNYVGVYHMDGDASTQLDSADASVSHDGTVSGATAGADGKIGPAYDFDGTNDVITVSDESELDLSTAGTFEAWMKTDDTNGSESDFSSFVSVDAPNGADELESQGVDMVIVGENMHYGSSFCSGATALAEVASSTLSGSAFRNWVGTPDTSDYPTCGAGEGAQFAVDSDGVHIYYFAITNTGTTEKPHIATSTVSGSAFGPQVPHSQNLPNGSGADEHGGVDFVMVGDNLYVGSIQLSTATEQISTTTMQRGTTATTTWSTLSNPSALAGAAAQGCNIAIDSDGSRLYYVAYCHDASIPAVETYASASSSVGTSGMTWISETAPDGMGAGEIGGIDIAVVGGRILHAASFCDAATETFSTASSSVTSGGALTWTTRSGPNGCGATNGDPADAMVETDGKNVYYGAFNDENLTEAFYIASSTLPAHPFLSKRNSYEMIQVGNGYFFDWPGKPYGFGTSTQTGTWKHVVVTYNGATLNMYEDGVLRRTQETAANGSAVSFETNVNDMLIGAGHRSVGTQIFFDGTIDEVRVSNTARSADWIQTQYNNQNATSTFYTLGGEENSSLAPTVITGGSGNVSASGATLFGNITHDGGDAISDYGFATSTDPNFLTDVATTSLGVGAVGNFQGTISGLSADTLYYYRAYATNGIDTGYGVVRSLFTGNSTVTRAMRLFEGFLLRLTSGKMIIFQK